MNPPATRVPQEVTFLLNSSRLPWRIVVGRRHFKIVIQGKLAGILPRSHTRTAHQNGGRAHQNLMAQLRRTIKEAQA